MKTPILAAALVAGSFNLAFGQASPSGGAPVPAGARGEPAGARGAGQAADKPAYKQLSRAQLDALLKDPAKVLLLDVRRPDEVQSIGGFAAYLSIQAKDLEQQLAFLPKDRAIVTVSNHAGRAGKAAELLDTKGFTVAGSIGVQNYEAEGGTLVRVAVPAGRQTAAGATSATGAAPAAGAAAGPDGAGRQAGAQAQAPPSPIDQRTARQILAAAEQAAAGANAKVAIAIVDVNGDLVALERRDGATSRAVASAQGKARAAILFGVPTKAVADAIAAGTPLPVTVTPAAAAGASIVTNQGGVPLFINGKLAGAVGVGGSASAEDERFAKAGVDAVRAAAPQTASR